MQGKELRDVLTLAKTHGGRWAAIAARRVNRGDAIGALLFLLATTVFSVITVRMMGSHASLSFYDLLRLLNGGDVQGAMSGEGAGAGIYALLWLLAVFGPLLPSFLSHRGAKLAYFLPVALWGITLAGVLSEVRELMNASRQLSGFMGGSRASRNMAGDIASTIWNSLSFGFGFYLSLVLAVCFAVRGVAALRRRA
ncbi:hypothetical protein RAS12_24570 [Achromobacter seleniivolatilans]|uniref:DNA translocase FtsK 4TM region domain-containing protein n=1 Tax=Achromobacter seleniivolatilans TaxID=3047478 RepID=A0ABY9M1L0_9BURK|nr:hypothetical protein [Achromobacter sp. R39]WMD19757.1 hypothetical protein RAS12_24570 [Achromobacter sp. R39]